MGKIMEQIYELFENKEQLSRKRIVSFFEKT